VATTSFAQSGPIATSLRTAPNPLVLWHLLSLDAPTVAMLWTWFIARSSGVRLPLTAVLAMGIAVWMLYAADRLLDSRSSLTTRPSELEARHHFHRTHQRSFRRGILLAAFALCFLLPQLALQSIRLYTLLGAPLLAYFVLIHRGTQTSARTPRLPKEIAVGIFFSAATFIPTVARNPTLRLSLLPAALLFGLVCSLNCLFIYAWEHPDATGVSQSATHPATRLALRYLPTIAALVALASLGTATGLLSAHHRTPWPLPAATAAAANCLLVLHRARQHLSAIPLRAAADLCLLTPLLLIPMLAR